MLCYKSKPINDQLMSTSNALYVKVARQVELVELISMVLTRNTLFDTDVLIVSGVPRRKGDKLSSVIGDSVDFVGSQR